VADYVACVRAQGAQLGGTKSEQISAEAGYLGARAAGASEVRESLEKRYSASDAAMLEIIRGCNANVHAAPHNAVTSQPSGRLPESVSPRAPLTGDWEFVCTGIIPERDVHHLQQDGAVVVGTSPRFASYRAEGTVSGRTVNGRWTNVLNNGPAQGRFEYVFDSTAESLSGGWGYGDNAKQFKCVAKRM